MKQLNANWLFEGWLDVEYKTYMLLDYLQHAKAQFHRNRLYPVLGEMAARHAELLALQQGKADITAQFPRQISGIDWQNRQFEYKTSTQPLDSLQDLEAILEVGKSLLGEGLEVGKQRYEEVAQKLEWLPVGLLPLRKEEGYLLLGTQTSWDTLCYRYELSLFENNLTPYRSLKTRYIGTFRRSLVESWESLKAKIIRQFSDLPNPATFAAIFPQWLPVQPTLLPVAKREFMRIVSTS